MIYEVRKHNESYFWEKYTYAIDIRPALIILDEIINNREILM